MMNDFGVNRFAVTDPVSSNLSHRRKHAALVMCASLLAWAGIFDGGLVAFGQRQPRDTLEAAKIEPHVGQVLPLAAEFRDHRGQKVQLGELVGQRPLVMCLVYFKCPMLCKLTADGLIRAVASVPENVGENFDVVVVSFDPRDTPRRASAARDHALGRYARADSAAGWHFLTGSQENIDLLTEAVGFQYVWDEQSKQFAHAAGLVIVSPDGVITEYLDGVNFSPRNLMAAVNRAAENQLTERPLTSFVRCYLYDPTTGKFGAAIQWTIRALGVATVLGLILGMYSLSRRKTRDEEGVDRS